MPGIETGPASAGRLFAQRCFRWLLRAGGLRISAQCAETSVPPPHSLLPPPHSFAPLERPWATPRRPLLHRSHSHRHHPSLGAAQSRLTPNRHRCLVPPTKGWLAQPCSSCAYPCCRGVCRCPSLLTSPFLTPETGSCVWQLQRTQATLLNAPRLAHWSGLCPCSMPMQAQNGETTAQLGVGGNSLISHPGRHHPRSCLSLISWEGQGWLAWPRRDCISFHTVNEPQLPGGWEGKKAMGFFVGSRPTWCLSCSPQLLVRGGHRCPQAEHPAVPYIHALQRLPCLPSPTFWRHWVIPAFTSWLETHPMPMQQHFWHPSLMVARPCQGCPCASTMCMAPCWPTLCIKPAQSHLL